MSGTEHPRPSRVATHQCPATACIRRVPRHQLMCPRHWAMVDRHTQRRAYAAYRAGTPSEHRQACSDAIDEVRSALRLIADDAQGQS